MRRNMYEDMAASIKAEFASREMMATECLINAQGMLRVMSANDWIQQASTRPDPKTWFNGMIVSCENTVLFAASNVGKSILAVQIAEEIAQSEKVLYLDLEMSDKQFQLRYTDGNQKHLFPENFLRAELNVERLLDADFEQGIIDSIEEAARHDVKNIIIDNITFVCINAEKSEAAGEFMKRVIFLKNKYALTIIAIAHTPKRPYNSPLTQFDLAGSARLINLFDAGIALGCSVRDRNIRYIKQVKTRTGELIYDEDNVAVCELTKEGGWLHLEFTGSGSERDHLAHPRVQEDKSELRDQVRDLLTRGCSIRDIERETGMSHGSAQRMVKEIKSEFEQEKLKDVPSVPGVPSGMSGTLGTPDIDDGDLPL